MGEPVQGVEVHGTWFQTLLDWCRGSEQCWMGGMVPGSAGSVPWFQTVLDEELLRYLVYLECVCVSGMQGRVMDQGTVVLQSR